MKRARKFYALEYAYGTGCRNVDGCRANLVHTFESAVERDAWADAGPEYTDQAGYREATDARDRRVRRALHPLAARYYGEAGPFPYFDRE